MTADENRQAGRPKGASQADSGQPADKAIEMPRPTQDQEEYLTEIQRQGAQFDPTTVVGGPRQTKA